MDFTVWSNGFKKRVVNNFAVNCHCHFQDLVFRQLTILVQEFDEKVPVICR